MAAKGQSHIASLACRRWFYDGNCGVTCIGHDFENSFELFWNAIADEADARQIAIDTARAIHLGPEIDEDEVAVFNGNVCGSRGLKMGIAAV